MMRCKRTGEIEYDLTNRKKNFTCNALFVALKTFFTIFPDFISIFQTFSRSRKLLGKFQDFSRIQDSVQTLSFCH